MSDTVEISTEARIASALEGIHEALDEIRNQIPPPDGKIMEKHFDLYTVGEEVFTLQCQRHGYDWRQVREIDIPGRVLYHLYGPDGTVVATVVRKV